MNQFAAADWLWGQHRAEIMAAPKNEWAIDPYAWDGLIEMTPIEDAMWTHIRLTNSVFYPQWPACGFYLDFANPRAKVAIECDGKAYHTDKEKDARRDAKLRDNGWTIYRFPGWLCVTDSDEETSEPGEAFIRLDYIARAHGLRRDGKRLDVTLEDGWRAMLTTIMHANGLSVEGEPL